MVGEAFWELVGTVASIFLLCWAMIARPTMARCPERWYVNGIRPSGWYECRPAVLADPDNDGTHGRPDVTSFDPRMYRGMIACTGGSHPIVMNFRTVGCQR